MWSFIRSMHDICGDVKRTHAERMSLILPPALRTESFTHPHIQRSMRILYKTYTFAGKVSLVILRHGLWLANRADTTNKRTGTPDRRYFLGKYQKRKKVIEARTDRRIKWYRNRNSASR
ncbi:hypothetical protein ABW21_db0204624 [Orbilia brochopaga]|nr:hypothetical protein ABW21_db0204624 [Drechslerella brochopaga]